jgi:ubiquinone/menaquinone biosynthesis C-methylase UbiE
LAGYYSDKLNAERLKRVYEIAPPRTRQYLQAEVEHICRKINPGDIVLELGCGYGRILPVLARKARIVFGIDSSFTSIRMGRKLLKDTPNCFLATMDAVKLGFRDNIFNVVVCIQNGISAFHVDRLELMAEAIRVAKPGGAVLFSSYSNKFWDHRLEWFYRQSEEGLLGEIDLEKTGDGVIVTKDGFTGTAIKPEEFLSLASQLKVDAKIIEVDESSLFCEILKKGGMNVK